MTETFVRMNVRDAEVNGARYVGTISMTGFIVNVEPENIAKRVLYPVDSEPSIEYEVGYSREIGEHFAIVFQNRKAKLTEKPFVVFRHINDLHRTMDQTEFDLLDLLGFLNAIGFPMSNAAVKHSVRRINNALAEIFAPISLTYRLETICVAHNLALFGA